MSLTWLDSSIVIIYFAIILFIGFVIAGRTEKKKHSSVDFLLAGRKVTLPFFVATLVATWYGNILGMGEFIFQSGVVAWLCFAFPYYIAAYFFAKYVAMKIRESDSKTIPEQITKKYGKKAGWFSAIIVLIITLPAAYILMLGIMINLLFDISLWLSIIIGAVLSLAFLYNGGFKADVLTNTAQFVIMYIGFFALLYFTFSHFGSISDMLDNLPKDHKALTGGLSWQYILSWFIISLQTFVDPGFHQRCAASDKPKTAKNGILISIIFWIVFDSLTLMTGLYAKAYVGIDNPIMTYPMLADVILPVFWKGLFVIALLSTIMSTLDSYAFLSAATIGNDIFKPLRHKLKFISGFSTKKLIQIGLVITSVFAVLLAILIPSAVDLIYKTSSIAIPGLIFPLLLSFSNKYTISKNKVVVLMLFASLSSLIWTLGKEFTNFGFFESVEPMMIGIFISIILSFLFIRKMEKKYE